MKLAKGSKDTLEYSEMNWYRSNKHSELEFSYHVPVYEGYISRFNYYLTVEFGTEKLRVNRSSGRIHPDAILDSFIKEGMYYDDALEDIKRYNDYVIGYVNSKFGFDINKDLDHELVSVRYDMLEKMSDLNAQLMTRLRNQEPTGALNHDLQVLGSAYSLVNAKRRVLGY